MNAFERTLFLEIQYLQKRKTRAEEFLKCLIDNRETLTDEDVQVLQSWYEHSNEESAEIMKKYLTDK